MTINLGVRTVRISSLQTAVRRVGRGMEAEDIGEDTTE
jgi:hypothetical protein